MHPLFPLFTLVTSFEHVKNNLYLRRPSLTPISLRDFISIQCMRNPTAALSFWLLIVSMPICLGRQWRNLHCICASIVQTPNSYNSRRLFKFGIPFVFQNSSDYICHIARKNVYFVSHLDIYMDLHMYSFKCRRLFFSTTDSFYAVHTPRSLIGFKRNEYIAFYYYIHGASKSTQRAAIS